MESRPYPAWWKEAAGRRRKLLDAAVARLRANVHLVPGAHGAIVFGSYARDEVGPESDLDIILLQDTDVPLTQRGDDFRTLVPLGVSYDLLVYTPEQFERLVLERPILAEARRSGIWIDAAASA